MTHKIQKHKGFTLIEMVFVMTILGIVAAISSEIIAKGYITYINQKALYKASINTELAAIQIANRLTYAIPRSIVARDDGNNTLALRGIEDLPPKNTFTTLQWIGYDREGFITRSAGSETAIHRRPGWSGFIDLSATTRTDISHLESNINLSSPASNLILSKHIISTLSKKGTQRSLIKSAIYMPIDALLIYNSTHHYYNHVGSPGIYSIAAIPDNQTIQINAPAKIKIKEQYQIAWSAYAIVPTIPNEQGEFDLVLHYNFQPWQGEVYNGKIAQTSTLIKNVTVFRFTGSVNSIRFKLCQHVRTGGSDITATFISVCKEKVVLK